MLKAKQLKYIELLLANPLVPDTVLAEEVGVNRNTLHAWKLLPEFQEEYKARLQEIWKDGERVAVETMQSLAREGDFKASKYILDSLGYAPTSKIDANLKTTIVVDIDEE